MSEHEQESPEVPDDVEMPRTEESEVDEPEEGTEDPDVERDLVDGVGFHDEEATVLDTETPDVGEEPDDDESEEG